MKKYHQIETVQFLREKLCLRVDGKKYEFELSAISEKLAAASDVEREKDLISSSG